jgi:glutathione peroxidase
VEDRVRTFLKTALGVAAMMTSALVTYPSAAVDGSAFNFEFNSIDGSPMKLEQWRGKVLLVVNTASFCGYTKQYAGLQQLWSKYEKQGLVVVGVPSNDFGGQEPKAEGEIKKFCQGAFGVTFPLTEKQVVTGDTAHPFYKWATAGTGEAPGWNFHKYLIGRDGRLIASISTRAAPDSPSVTDPVERALAEVAAKPAG